MSAREEQPCARCIAPESDEMHGPVEACEYCRAYPGEESAHHKYQPAAIRATIDGGRA